MRKISIIATDYKVQDLGEVVNKLNSLFYRQYHYELVLFEGSENLDAFKSNTNLKILRAIKKLTLNQKITECFAVSDGACTILADFTVIDCYKHIQNLLQLWQNGANVVLSKYKDYEKKFSTKFKMGLYNCLAGMFHMYETSACNNTFQLFSKCVADVIKKSPEQNAYLRNTKAWQDYKVMIVSTNSYLDTKESVQKFSALDKLWTAMIILGIVMLGAFAGFGDKMFAFLPRVSTIQTAYLFVSAVLLIVGFPSLLVSRIKNKYANCYKAHCAEYLFDPSLKRYFDLDLYDERQAGLKNINFDATALRPTSEAKSTKTYNHSYEKYVPQFLKDGSLAPKRKMEYVGANKGPVLYSYLQTATPAKTSTIVLDVNNKSQEKIKTSKKNIQLNQTVKKMVEASKSKDKVVLETKKVDTSNYATKTAKNSAEKKTTKKSTTTTAKKTATKSTAKKATTATKTTKQPETKIATKTTATATKKTAPKTVKTQTKTADKSHTEEIKQKSLDLQAQTAALKKQLEDILNSSLNSISKSQETKETSKKSRATTKTK